MAEVVYGKEHVQKHHLNAKDDYFYKPRYLKTRDIETGEIYAFPDGLPGFNDKMKVHLIGHSMGTLVAQNLQHLLAIGEFGKNS